MVWLFIFILVALLTYGFALVWLNRNFPHGDRVEILNQPTPLPDVLGANITITTWNIGYAGLGRDSDFVTDGGTHWLPPSSKAVADNLSGIVDLLGQNFADIFLLQEASHKSPLSYWQPVRDKVTGSCTDHFALFRPDISTRGLPWPLRITHGALNLSRAKPKSVHVQKLPTEPDYLAKLIKRNYALLVTRFAIEGKKDEWVIANLHLAAFDSAGKTRFEQIEAAFEFARDEYEKGNFVVLGGDWNLALTKSAFPHTTHKKALFWLFDLPHNKIPQDWQLVFDPAIPTVRTNYQPYVEGENYTAIIDGFIVSPNVRTNKVTTTNTGFEHTDHMPVTASFSTIEPQSLK